jgi:arylsulfatase A-like enzyme
MARTAAIFLVVLAFLAATSSAPAADRPPHPHILFILADDLGPGDLGCYGGTIAATPHIDRLAKDGIRFMQYYAAAPVCSPSRCGLITGQFPARWRITTYLHTMAGNRQHEQADFLDPQAPSLPRALQEAGYKTAHFGKWHLGGGRDVVDPPKFAAYGYDESAGTWESPEPHPDITATDWIWSDRDKVKRWQRSAFFVDQTLDFLRRHKDSPCFVNLWLDDAHTPWVPNAEASPKSNDKKDLKAVLIENDRQIGRLREGLRELGIDKTTLVVFASDNGPLPTFKGQRTAGLRGSKISLYEGGIRLPFIACWPEVIPPDSVNDTTVLAAVDMFPTLCTIACAKPPEAVKFDGEDHSAELLGTSAAERSKPLFWEYGRNAEHFASPPVKRDRSPNLAVRDGRWKLLINADGSGAELYDMLADPNETRNVAASETATTERLTRLVLDWRKWLP